MNEFEITHICRLDVILAKNLVRDSQSETRLKFVTDNRYMNINEIISE